MESLVSAMAAAVTQLETVVPYASAYARRNRGTQVRIDAGGVTCAPVPPDAGITLSAWTGQRFCEDSSDRLDEAGIRAAADRLTARVAALPREADPLLIDAGSALQQSFEQPQRRDATTVPAAEKIAIARSLRERLLAGGAASAMAVVGDVHADIAFVNRQRRLVQCLHRVRQIVRPSWRAEDQQVQLYGGFERIGGWEHQLTTLPYIDDLLRDGPRLLHAQRLPNPGEHTCVLSGEFAGLLAHEAFGHGTEQDLYVKERSEGAAWLGKAVGSPLVQLSDDPANGWAASYFFDDEGILAQPTEIMRDGMLIAGINDRLSQAWLSRRGQAGAKTANGRREAYDHKPYTRMTNTFFGAGNSSTEELIRGVERGYLLTHPSNGMEDPKGWGIQLEGAMAEEIVSGKLTGTVFGPVVVTGYVPDILRSIDGVGRDVVEASLGTCGKGYKEWVKVTDGGPALRLKAVLA